MKTKIIVTGGSGRFGKILKEQNFKNFIFPNKRQLNILKYSNIENYLKKRRPKILIQDSASCILKKNIVYNKWEVLLK